MSGYPFIKPGSTIIHNDIPAMPQVGPGVRTFIDVPSRYEYVVQPEDTVGATARKVFGVNTKFYRDLLRRQGFETGRIITIEGAKNG